VVSLDGFWAGNRSDTLALLAERLLDRIAARRNALEVEEQLKLLRSFYASDILKLRAAIYTMGRNDGFVPQQQRDSLFIASRTAPGETPKAVRVAIENPPLPDSGVPMADR
jgi:hypothetical protein